MIGIYKITNKVNGKMYIGQTTNSEERIKEHFKPRTLRERKHLPLYRAINEFGKENFEFEMLEECDIEKLNERETFYIQMYSTFIEGYNISSEAVSMHDAMIAKDHGRRMSEWNKKMWQNNEYRQERSKASSNLQKKRLENPEYRAEKSRQLKQYTDTLKKPIGQYDKQGNLLAKYNGIRIAERETGINSSAIAKVAKGNSNRKTAGGFIWKYL